MLDQLQLILKALPWTGPAVAGGAVLGLLSMLVFPRHRSRSDRVGFALLVWCLVVAAVVTLSPVKNNYFGVPNSGCDWTIWRPLAREYWFRAGSRPPNVWLFFPAGVGVMLLDGFWRRFFGIALLFALPPGIETIQDLYPELKRSCSSQDVVDNWTGLVLGLLVGLVLALVIGLIRLARKRSQVRAHRRRAALEESNTTTPGPYGWHDDEPRTDARDGALPLGGGEDARHYDDFSDFDDTPRSTRWYEEPTRAAEAPAEPGDRYAEWHTQPASVRGRWQPAPLYADQDATRGQDATPVESSRTSAGQGRPQRAAPPEATRVMPTSGNSPDDPDSTQIIRR